jgi:threonine synthase
MTKTSKTFTQVACMVCGHTTPPSLTQTTCEKCGSPWLEARYDYEAVAKRWPRALWSRDKDLWRYRELLPIAARYRVSMGEGWGPLLRARQLGKEVGHKHLYIKDERQSPTSSFKDRQASLAVSALKAAGIDECVMASTGNASAAYAAYCARAGIKLWVFVPSLVPVEKMHEATLYGAEVIKVTGTYDQAKVIAARFAERHGLHIDRGAKAIVGKESMKTIAFEIAEQLRWKAPDWYIQAVSGGIGPVGVWKGFCELKRMGLIDKLPQMGIIQAEGCSPMAQAFEAGRETAEPMTPHTAITVLATGDPGHAYTLLYRAIKEHGGAMAGVTDGDAFRAMRRLARVEGFSVEPAAAVAFAGLEKLLAEGIIKPDETVVVSASGHTMPVEKYILGDQHIVGIEVSSPLSEQWGLPEEGLNAAFERLDEKITSIVVIDDTPRDSRLIRRLLEGHKSYRVFEAHSGAEGIELVRERQPDLVILDLMMPEVDGFDVLGRLKADAATQDIPVIVVTAKSLTVEERKRLEGQSVSVWPKGTYKTADLVQHVVEQLGGEAETDDAPPPAAGPGEKKAKSEQPTRATRGEEAYEHTLLLIEDNPLDGRLVRRTLEQHVPCRILEAHSGEQALRLLDQHTPDLVILDLMLPDISGFDILKHLRLKSATRDVPVVVLTAKDLTADERALLSQYVDATWIKGSVERSTLQEHVYKVIEQRDNG